ncbi:NlpC/P60 family protein [Bifidobacterium olomucense]|uniref:NlpC/P60 family n=1 Tax=Bifidobacterium olomucense TaxID=2675324 RepID=A0A7Y0HWG6_9BIFI|nr:NlpC/P60 family protein [Bifidobacterium sp. DSM 109959]NMM97277.1 NlpC/P60 family [Bifidobacterium sp. DSM 109959]
MKTKSVASSCVAVLAASMCFFAFAPAAIASTEQEGTITSTRSFPSYTKAYKNLTAEAVSTEVNDDADWGGLEDLNVPQTESQAEKEAAAAKKAAEEAAAAQAEAEAKAQTQTQSEAASSEAASRSASRSSITYADTSNSVTAGAAASIDRAYSLIGQSMDCTALVTQALAARGINFHGWPEEYVNVPGGQVVTDGTLQPGDILIYANTGGYNGGAHYDHVALYVGNGMAVHGGWNGYSVALATAMTEKITVVVRIP